MECIKPHGEGSRQSLEKTETVRKASLAREVLVRWRRMADEDRIVSRGMSNSRVAGQIASRLMRMAIIYLEL